jgi:hypothetical protein
MECGTLDCGGHRRFEGGVEFLFPVGTFPAGMDVGSWGFGKIFEGIGVQSQKR